MADSQQSSPALSVGLNLASKIAAKLAKFAEQIPKAPAGGAGGGSSAADGAQQQQQVRVRDEDGGVVLVHGAAWHVCKAAAVGVP